MKAIAALASFLLLAGCGASEPRAADTVPGVFNGAETIFEAEVLPDSLSYSEDYDFSAEAGLSTPLRSCAALAALDPESLTGFHFRYYSAYRADCVAAQAYRGGRDAAVSHVRGPSLAEQLPGFPNAARPHLGGTPPKTGVSLGEAAGPMEIEAESADALNAVFDGFDTRYVRLGFRDVDGDGVEDLIVRMRYDVQGGSAQGTQTVFITRLETDGPMRLIDPGGLPALADFNAD